MHITITLHDLLHDGYITVAIQMHPQCNLGSPKGHSEAPLGGGGDSLDMNGQVCPSAVLMAFFGCQLNAGRALPTQIAFLEAYMIVLTSD